MNGPPSPTHEKVPVRRAACRLLLTTVNVSRGPPCNPSHKPNRISHTVFCIPGFNAEEKSCSLAVALRYLRHQVKILGLVSNMDESRHNLSKANASSHVNFGLGNELLRRREVRVVQNGEGW